MQQQNGKHDREQLISIVRMIMYLIDELREQGLSDSADLFTNEMKKLQDQHNVTEADLFPEGEG